MAELKLIPLGGMGNVTQNMYLYEYENEILIVDCGIGFPDVYMPGVDSLIPDISYLLKAVDEGKQIVGLVFSHGHDDHIAAAPYVLEDLPKFPIYASALTAGFAKQRFSDKGLKPQINVLKNRQPVQLGQHFRVTALAMTHSVPDTKHLIIETPEGLVYHGSDFKLDASPIDGILPDYDFIKQISGKNVMLQLIDCLRCERPEVTASEAKVGPVLEDLMASTRGKFIVTLMSSHIHRIQQVADLAKKHKRKIVFLGRSVEQNVEISRELGVLNIASDEMVYKKYMSDYRDEELCVVVAGSQGQEGSSLVRAVFGEHPMLQITANDRVVFSADVIPGNEIPFYKAIDELARNKIEVVYPDVSPGIHQSGHASAPEQRELVSMVKPKLLMPIGGTDRHRAWFKKVVGEQLGFSDKQILIPAQGEILGFSNGQVRVVDKIPLYPRIVDGLGVGDVGPVVLSDRLSLSQAGIIVLVIPRQDGEWQLRDVTVISRGFVFMKEADEVVKFIKDRTAEIITEMANSKDEDIKRTIEKRLARKLYKVIAREPLIVPVIIET